MDSQQAFDFLKKGLHVSLGATTSLIESVQDPVKREENLAQLNLGFNELTRIWEAKGETTEAEARQFIDSVVTSPSGSSAASSPAAPISQPLVDPVLIQDLQDLTVQISTMREELAKPQDMTVE
ncbi:hypothetical protein [Lyngbya confervoides]|uniref:Uncharacterized protein n=1 Tax=Lyngbya confervoides BDU141951 TaxID=1574623 RepID=A0ABD4T005_9CYAN|nr:hypothetical protein [Lyngbya confervoides]MCM1981735.1 hypothetical protein [Lyngbya confervoides BDU141951]